MKLPTASVPDARQRIEEKNPLKQGLKLSIPTPAFLTSCYWREESIKTRIETCVFNKSRYGLIIEEKNPLKQGLKLVIFSIFITNSLNWREESIKTRIETLIAWLSQRSFCYWREESIKTRIETVRRCARICVRFELKRRIH